MNCIADGRWPERDHRNKPFAGDGTYRDRYAGQWLAPVGGNDGLRGFLTNFLADQKYAKEAFEMPFHYGKTACCWFCNASKTSGPQYMGDFREEAWQLRGRRTTAEYLATFAGASTPPLTEIRGFSLEMLSVDFLHCDHLGVASWLAGNGLYRAAEVRSEGQAGAFEVRMNAALRLIFYDFVQWCGANNMQHSEREFSITRLSVSSRNAKWPDFKGKAHNTAVVCKFLTAYLQSEPGFNSEDDLLMRHAFVGWAAVQDVVHDAEDTFTHAQASKLLHSGTQCLKAWGVLSQVNARRKLRRFQVKPKRHYWEEGIRKAFRTRVNPRTTWVYKHESFVGMISKIAGKTHPATSSRTVLKRWLLGLTRSKAKRFVCRSKVRLRARRRIRK